jgi:hypothetical protein
MQTGTAVERYLFSPLYHPTSAWSVIGWWERRRVVYNLTVGAAGLVTVATALILTLLTPGPKVFGPPLLGIPIYAIAANLFYSLGAPLDLLLRRRLREQAGPVAQALFRYGLAFAVGLTLLPIPLMVFGWVMSLFYR